MTRRQIFIQLCQFLRVKEHKDIEPSAELYNKDETLSKTQMMEVIDEVVFELPRIGVKTILRNIPIRQFHISLASIASKYGEPTEVRKQNRVKTS